MPSHHSPTAGSRATRPSRGTSSSVIGRKARSPATKKGWLRASPRRAVRSPATSRSTRPARSRWRATSSSWVSTATSLFDGSSPRRPITREELLVQLGRRRGHVLQVAEHAARLQHVEHLAVQRALALVDDVVDRERRHDEVERAPVSRQRVVEVVLDDRDGGAVGEPLAGRGRASPARSRSATPAMPGRAAGHAADHLAVAAAQVEHPTRRRRHDVEQVLVCGPAPRVGRARRRGTRGRARRSTTG